MKNKKKRPAEETTQLRKKGKFEKVSAATISGCMRMSHTFWSSALMPPSTLYYTVRSSQRQNRSSNRSRTSRCCSCCRLIKIHHYQHLRLFFLSPSHATVRVSLCSSTKITRQDQFSSTRTPRERCCRICALQSSYLCLCICALCRS